MKKIIVILYCVIAIALVAATIFEAFYGAVVVKDFIYGSSWFFALWAVLGLWGLVYVFQRHLWQRPAALLLHTAFVVILLGAGITWIFGEKGVMHVREGQQQQTFLRTNDNTMQQLPFSLWLEDFSVSYYPGTNTPADYQSHVLILDSDIALHGTISMNTVLVIHGYRLYQTSFDDDGRGTILSVNHDPVGVGVTYAGYALLVLAMVFVLFSKKCGFRKLLKHPNTSVQTNLTKYVERIFSMVLVLLFVCQTIGIGLYGYTYGRIPLSNMYETMLSLSWNIVLIALLLQKKFRLVVPFGFLLSVFTLLVAWFGLRDSQITPLMPVLRSPILSVHVSCLILSYALLAFTAINGLLAIVLHIKDKSAYASSIGSLTVLSKIMLYPATFLLGIGIFVGAVWANNSWGGYWSWDPKETWALITFLLYAGAFHSDSVSRFNKPIFFHVYIVVAFATVLMTYFGVNVFLGGMHAYK